jgi:hypothetical protein
MITKKYKSCTFVHQKDYSGMITICNSFIKKKFTFNYIKSFYIHTNTPCNIGGININRNDLNCFIGEEKRYRLINKILNLSVKQVMKSVLLEYPNICCY